jgi:Tol biopolymer transport system component
MQGSIWIVDPKTGKAVEVTTTIGYASSPTWSPDGRWIVYTADYGHHRIQLEAVELSTGNFQSLTHDDAIYLDPVFSPDGGRLAYVATLPDAILISMCGQFTTASGAVREHMTTFIRVGLLTANGSLSSLTKTGCRSCGFWRHGAAALRKCGSLPASGAAPWVESECASPMQRQGC